MAAWKRAFGEVAAAPNGREALSLIFRSIALVADDLSFERIIAAARKIDPITGETAMTIAEKLRAEGRADGEVRGKAEGKRLMLAKLLSLKLGDVSAEASERLTAATDEELELWTERVLRVNSLDELCS